MAAHRRTRCDGGRLAQVKAAINALDLGQVSVVAWEALREANSSFQLDLDICIDHVAPEACRGLAKHLQALHGEASDECGNSEAFWQWLASSADSDSQGFSPQQTEGLPTLSRAKALVAVLGQALGSCTARLAAPAGAAYLALLEFDGAARFWGTVFQPVVFHQLLRIISAPLSAANGARRRAGSAALAAATEEREGLALPDSPEPEEGPDDKLTLSVAEARDLLQLLVAFLKRPSPSSRTLSGDSPEVAGMIVSRLGSLLQHPVEERVARSAAGGLAALAAGTSSTEGPERSREARRRKSAVIRAALPAVMMTQDSGALGLPAPTKLSQQVRLVALDLLSTIIQSHPDLLVVQPRPASAAAAAVASDAPDAAQASGARSGQDQGEDDPVLAALQTMCVQSPDRADWRVAAAESFVALMVAAAFAETPSSSSGQQDREAASLVRRGFAFLERLMVSERASCRATAVDAAAVALVRSSELASDGPTRASLEEEVLLALAHRCQDISSTVRGRALSCLATSLQHLANLPDGVELLRRLALGGEPIIDVSGLFRAASLDEKAWARRGGLVLFEASLEVFRSLSLDSETIVSFFDLNLLARLATDESVLVRKSAISCISSMLHECPIQAVASLWVSHVLPSMFDPEASVVEKALAEIDATVLEPLSNGTTERTNYGNRRAVELPIVLQVIRQESESIDYLRRVVGCMGKRPQGVSPKMLAESLLALVRQSLRSAIGEWPLVLWSMLEELAVVKAILPTSCPVILEAWDIICAHGDAAGETYASISTQILRVIAQVAPMLHQAATEKLWDGLKGKMERLALGAEGARAALMALSALEKSPTFSHVGAPLGSDVAHCNWRIALVQRLDACICNQAGSLAQGDEEEISRCMFTLGELILYDAAVAASISGVATATIQAIASNTVHRDGAHVPVSAIMRGHAFATLGKLCLQREELAKKSVELFVLHLDARESLAVRNNVLIILRDLCERYTSLVDRFVACMTDLLRDPHEILRKQSVMVLASLLSENFIKFKGSIVHRFLYVLSDHAASVRAVAESVVVRILHPRSPSLLSQMFVDVICGLNGWAGHPGFQSAVDNKDFTLLKSRGRRAIIYRFVLSLMTNEQKFSVCSQMVTAFLTPFVDAEDRLELPRSEVGPCGQAMHDVLQLLVCKEMRICFSPKQASQDEDVELTAAGYDAARTALAVMFKRVMCEHVVPVLVQLKNLMQAQHSPFLGGLRRCLCEILREFKDDLQDILSSDRQLAGEIAYDLGVTSEVSTRNAIADSTAVDEPPSREWAPMQPPPRPPFKLKKGLSKAAVTAVIRGAGRRRSLTKVMGDDASPTADGDALPICGAEATSGASSSRRRQPVALRRAAAPADARRREAAESNEPEAPRQQVELAEQPPAKRSRFQPMDPPKTPARKVVASNEMPQVGGRDVPTPHSVRSAGGAYSSLMARIMDSRAKEMRWQ